MTVASIYDLFDKTPDDPTPEPSTPKPFAGTVHPYAAAALRAECADLSTLPPDSRRNSTLNEAAFKMARHVAAGSIDAETVLTELTAAARQAGLPQAEIDQTLRPGSDDAAINRGQAHPRVVPPPRENPVWTLNGSAPHTDTAGSTTGEGNAASDAEPNEHTSWWPRNLQDILAGREPEQPPTHLTRDDGQPLFYPGAVNGLLGESESGKSWVAQMLVAQQLVAGKLVVYLDFEDMARNVVARLRALGATDKQISELLMYVNPDETLHPQAAADLQTTLAHGPDTIIVDGFNAAMTLLDLKLESNVDVTHFFQRFLRPLAALGSCVVYIDHVPKDKENRGKGGIGAQAKRAMTSGTALLVEVVKPFGRGMRGLLSLTIDKDKGGHVRGCSHGARAGMVHIDSSSDGTSVTMNIEASENRETIDGQPAKFRPTVLMERVSIFLETVPGGASKKAIEDGVTGKATGIRMALDCLVDEGFAVRETSGQTVLTKIVKAYREINDDPLVPTSSPSSPPRPTSSRDEAYETSSPSSPTPPYGGVARDEDEGQTITSLDDYLVPRPKVDRRTGELLD